MFRLYSRFVLRIISAIVMGFSADVSNKSLYTASSLIFLSPLPVDAIVFTSQQFGVIVNVADDFNILRFINIKDKTVNTFAVD